MSGYVERKYVFEGGSVPGKFFDDVYCSSHDARHLKVARTYICNWGDDLEITVSAECEETIDWHMKTWEAWEKNK